MILYLIVALLATLLGSAAGMGGGVIIKPVMDLLGDYNVTEISIFASITVLCMAFFSTTRQISKGFKVTPVLIAVTAGAVLGGSLGSLLLSKLIESIGADIITAIQSLVLLLLLSICLLYHKIPHRHIASPVLIALIGAALGLFSSFLGIGGGPINVAVLGIFLSLELRRAARASVFIILFSQGAGLVTKALSGLLAQISDYSVLALMVPAAIIGGLLGARLNHSLSDKGIAWLYRLSVVLVMFICAFNFYRAAIAPL